MAINANLLPNGLGESTGDDMVLVEPWYTGATVRYLSTVDGSDSNSGLERLQPKATLAATVTASSAGDWIVLASDYDETVTSVQTISLAGLVIVGAGMSAGVPTAKLTINADASLLSLEAKDIEIRNLLFPTSDVSNTNGRVIVGAGANVAADSLFKNCYFQCGANDTTMAVDVAVAPRPRFESCTFISTTTTAVYPGPGITISDADCDKAVMQSCVFDGGTKGFSGGVAMDASAATLTVSRFEAISLLRGADMLFEADSAGRINVGTTTGNGRVLFS